MKGEHMTSINNLLDKISAIIEAFFNGLNQLLNADLHGLEILGLFTLPGLVITVIQKLNRQKR